MLRAGMDDPDDPVFLSTLQVAAADLFALHPDLALDSPSARILRSVLMKPEHEAAVPWLASRVQALAEPPEQCSYTAGWLSSARWCVSPTCRPSSSRNGMRRLRLRPDALGCSTSQSPTSRPTGCSGLLVTVAATK